MDFNDDVKDDPSLKDENISKERQEYLDDLEELGLDEQEVEEKARVTLPLAKGDRSNILKLNNIALEYKAILEGKKKEEGSETYVQVGRAIASQKFIDVTYGFLNSHSEQANLVTSKDEETFFIQFVDAFNKVNNLILQDRSISPKVQSSIVKLVKDRLKNIGDIITNNKGNMDAVIGRIGEEEVKEDPLKWNF